MKKYLKIIYKKSEKEYFNLLKEYLENNEKKFIITANPETLTMAETDEEVSKMLLDKNNSVVPDGIAIVKACKMLDIPVTERIAGVDIAEYLLYEASQLKKKVYLFGSKQEVIDGMKNVIKKKYSGIKLVGATNGYIEDKDKEFENIKYERMMIFMLPSRMFFDDMLSDLEKESKMKCDIFEKDNKVFIEMDVPGYDKKDIKVECNKGNIVVKAEHHEKHEDNKKYLHRERKMYGRLERSFHLDDVDEETMEAEFKDGILTISVSKVDEDKNKRYIEVK